MGHVKTMYSLQGIFTDFLEDAEKTGFMIPAYQRGYKWGSTGGNSQVEVLLRDLYNAFDTRQSRYYLQFITVKEFGNELEVIDGQQRLTTITILFTALFGSGAIAFDAFFIDKLNYQVRHNFIQRFVYNDRQAILMANDWNDFLKKNETDLNDINNQDVFFIFQAFKRAQSFIQNISASKREEFIRYLCDKVYIIVNYLDADLNSERIFINVNKGIKLKDEDLVKGLLITKIPIDQQAKQFRLTEIEINEIRSNIGRRWDEISFWCSRDDIKNFFKINNETKGLGWLIKLTYHEAKGSDELYPLFSFIDNKYRTGALQAEDIFTAIRNTMLILDDWFEEPETYNLLGYLLHSKPSVEIFQLWSELKNIKTKTELIVTLKNKCKKALPFKADEESLIDLTYEEHRSELFNLFLMLDLAKVLPINKTNYLKYDFEKISSDNWSIEHIFPQNAKDFKKIKSLTKDDLVILKELLNGSLEEIDLIPEDKRTGIEILLSRIQSSEVECLIFEHEHELLEYLLKNKAAILHKVGNLALLKQGMNSSLSNHFFEEKRKIMVSKVSNGEFVPLHTYDVFSKLIIDSDTSLHIWSKPDIEKHQVYINDQINKINIYLNN